MNKRILLALYVRSGLGAYMPVDYKGHELAVEEHMEKFAEFIVKECIEQIRGEYLPVMESKEMMNIPHWEGYTQCGVDSVIAIREHFGIENEY